MDFIILVFIIAILVGLSKGGFGGPMPVVLITPLLSQFMPASQAVGLALPLLIFGDFIALSMYWRKWDIRQIKLLLPSALIGIALGILVLFTLAENGQDLLMQRILGIFTMIVVLYKVISERLRTVHYEPRRWHSYVAGAASGFGSALANVGSPPYTAYMLLQDVSPTSFMGTTTLFFFIVNMIKLPIVLLNSNVLNLHLLASVVWVIPVIPVATWIGRRFVYRVNQKVFEQFMLVLLFLVSLYLLLK